MSHFTLKCIGLMQMDQSFRTGNCIYLFVFCECIQVPLVHISHTCALAKGNVYVVNDIKVNIMMLSLHPMYFFIEPTISKCVDFALSSDFPIVTFVAETND